MTEPTKPCDLNDIERRLLDSPFGDSIAWRCGMRDAFKAVRESLPELAALTAERAELVAVARAAEMIATWYEHQGHGIPWAELRAALSTPAVQAAIAPH